MCRVIIRKQLLRKYRDSVRPGRWCVYSESDKRWKASGRAKAILFIAGMLPEVLKAIEKLKKKYGEPPADLWWEAEKDNG